MHFLMATIRAEPRTACHTCVAATVIKFGETEEHIFCGVLDKIMPVPVVSCAWIAPQGVPDEEPAPRLVSESRPC